MPLAMAPVDDNWILETWTGELMVVAMMLQPGYTASYDPCANSWRALPDSGVQRYADPFLIDAGLLFFETIPAWPNGFQSRLTLLDLEAGAFVDLPADSQPANQKRAVVATAEQLVWWGGALQHPDLSGPERWEDRNDGGIYDVATRQWRAMSTAGAPAGRTIDRNAAFTGNELLIWGGSSAEDPTADTDLDRCFHGGFEQCQRLGDGGVFHLDGESWTPMTPNGAPAARDRHLVIAIGSDVLVIDGSSYVDGTYVRYGDAHRYHVAEDRWSALELPQPLRDAMLGQRLPDDRHYEWTGSRLLIQIASGPAYVYDPATEAWQEQAEPSSGATCPRAQSRGVCTGADGSRDYGLFDAERNAWRLLEYPVRDAELRAPRSMWTGSQIIEWGGYRLGEEPPPGGCPVGIPCDQRPAPMFYTREGAVWTPEL